MKSELIPSLASYSLLGRSGLKVSPLCLGTMTFGTEWCWGSERAAAEAIFDRFLEAGGNFVDTADAYTNGKSEELLGEFISQRKNRDYVVLATKFAFGAITGDPNGGGNSRKTIFRSLEASLKRLRTDYIDLYWLHAWDMRTSAEEVMRTLDNLVSQGKVRYIGMSDVPAWYASRAQTLAEIRGYEKLAAFQLEYSLVSRNLEREHLPLAQETGIGLCAWSPLASGFLTGKYKRENGKLAGQGRLQTVQGSGNPVLEKFTSPRNWVILDTLLDVARELGKSPADVALNWVAKRPGVTSTLIGATNIEQLESNLQSLSWDMPAAARERLTRASAPSPTELDDFNSPAIQEWLSGGTRIHKEPLWHRSQGTA